MLNLNENKHIWTQRDSEIFLGFYETILSPDSVEEYFKDPCEEEPTPTLPYDEVRTYMKRTGEKYVKTLLRWVKATPELSFIEDMTCLNVLSPQFYNFTTDQLEIDVRLDKWDALRFAWNHQDEFNQYLKDNYSVASGWVPFPKNEFWKLLNQKKYFWDVFLDWVFSRLPEMDDSEDYPSSWDAQWDAAVEAFLESAVCPESEVEV